MDAIKLGAVHPTRDFNFVRDTVRGFIAVAECDAALGKVVNVGSNYEISVGDTARLIADIMGRDVTFTSDEQRLRPAGSEVERLWADNTLARTLAGWTPEYGGIEGLRRGLKETIDWFTEPSNLGRYKAGNYNI
jgi:nucleoside-diphosphate-sugar epimerase